MEEQVSPSLCKVLGDTFPNQLPKRSVIAEELPTNVIEPEGDQLFLGTLF